VVATNDVEDAFGHRGEDPVGDAGIHHGPLAIAIGRRGQRTDMAGQAELAERGFEEAAPLSIVALFQIEDDRDMMMNGEALDGRGSRRDELIVGGGRFRVVGRGQHWCKERSGRFSVGSKKLIPCRKEMTNWIIVLINSGVHI